MKPENGKMYTIYGSDALEDWEAEAECKHYKPSKGLRKWQKRHGYRWILPTGEVVTPMEVEDFKPVKQLKDKG